MDLAKAPWIDEDALMMSTPMLWHYTSLGTLERILDSGGLLCSDYERTNDISEFRAVKEQIARAMADHSAMQLRSEINLRHDSRFDKLRSLSLEELFSVTRADSAQLFEAMLTALPQRPQLVCFTAHDRPHHIKNGNLTMWRGYANAEDGVAIGFRTKAIVKASERWIERNALIYACFSKVSYLGNDSALTDRLSDAPELTTSHLNHARRVLGLSEHVQLPSYEAYLKFNILVASAKLPDFEDEREVRLMVCEASEEEARKRMQCAKIADRLLFPCGDSIREVMVGPNADQNAVAVRVEALLRKAHKRNVQVRLSETPFRYSS